VAVDQLEIQSQEPFEAWPYDVIRGVAHFAVDPAAEANRRIVDLDKAELDKEGRVRFSADFAILAPRQAGPDPPRLLFSVANRGRLGAVPFSLDTPWWDPMRESIAAGDGFLLRHGWAVAWCGWQWDVLSGPSSLALHAPEALIDGESIPGRVRVDFGTDVPIADHALGDSGPYFSFRSYPAADLHEADAVLTVRDALDGERRPIDRDRWAFAHDESGKAVPDDASIRLEGGFAPHHFYEVTYTTRRSPVVGAGLLAVRDFVSFLRHGDAGNPLAGQAEHAFGYGASQSGRFLRQFVYEGLNRDEDGRQVFDGILPHVAGARLGEFNQRYGQPSHFSHTGVGSLPPFSPAAGLWDRQLTIGGMPKVALTNTSWEYWRGDASLNHISGETGRDLPDGPDTRTYLFAGTDHLGPSPVKRVMQLGNAANSLDSVLLLRATVTNLASWAIDGRQPPASAVPRIADGTAVTAAEHLAAFPSIPGAHLPEPGGVAVVRRADLGPALDAGIVRLPPVLGDPYATFVTAADPDGIDRAGIRLPELVAPVATWTGWNPRRHIPGLPDVVHEFAGSVFPLPRTAEEAAATGDPRPSIAERYADRASYAAAAEAATAALVRDGYLLAEDAEVAIRRALARYDELAGKTSGPSFTTS
jgi:hypothetical protein